MLFFDANVVVYSIVNLDEDKLKISQELVNNALEENSILISPLVLQEVIYTLGKLSVEPEVIDENVDLWTKFSRRCPEGAGWVRNLSLSDLSTTF